jgi:cyclase
MAKKSTLITAFAAISCLGGLAAAVAAPAAIAPTPKPQQQPVALSVEPLKGGVYWVKGGSGANTGFIISQNEVIVIDAKMTEESAKAMLAEIRKVTPNPVKHIILTHSDGDHVNGLCGFAKGLTIIAHENTRKDMEEAFKDPKMSALLPYLPNETVARDRALNIDGVRVNLFYFGPAHTSGDLVVYLPEQKIAFIGDLVFLGRDPLVHRQKGGTSLGLTQALKKILALDADTFISGHNDPLTKADIQGLLASIEEKQAKVKALIQQGKSLDEVKSAFGVVEAPTQGARRWPSLVETIYLDITEGR